MRARSLPLPLAAGALAIVALLAIQALAPAGAPLAPQAAVPGSRDPWDAAGAGALPHPAGAARAQASKGPGAAALPGSLGDALRGPLPDVGLPAAVVQVQRATAIQEYPVFAADGTSLGTQAWRVTRGTGNCCENYVAATPAGRLVNLGGSYVHYTDDQGQTWYRVNSVLPVENGEGAISAAPNGDVVAVEWDPYTADHLFAVKYSAADGTWRTQEAPVHTPFYDRPWLSVVPGPFVVEGNPVPYVVIVRGGFPVKQPYPMSLDGLTYAAITDPTVLSLAVPGTTGLLDLRPNPDLDWVQPIGSAGIVPLGNGEALDRVSSGCATKKFDNLVWACFDLPEGLGPGRFLVDANARLHHMAFVPGSFTYRWSDDGGATWSGRTVALPPGWSAGSTDFRALSDPAVTAIAVHFSKGGADQDVVYKFVDGELARVYHLGKGDTDVRFDFASMAILPDGRIAASFFDQEHRPNAVAIEV